MKPLSPKQEQVYLFLVKSQEEGSTPSIREISEHLGIKARTTVVDHLKALEERGLVTRVTGTRKLIVADIATVDKQNYRSTVSKPPKEHPSHTTLPFTERQQAIREKLFEKSPELSVLYEGAVFLLQSARNVGQVYLIAHAVREIANSLPAYCDLPISTDHLDYGKHAQEIAACWESIPSLTSIEGSSTDSEPVKEVTIPLEAFEVVNQLVTAERNSLTSLQRASYLYAREGGVVNLDQGSLRPLVRRWVEVTGWFMKHVHNPRKVTQRPSMKISECKKNFIAFEDILFSLLHPTIEGIKELTPLIEEANQKNDGLWLVPTSAQVISVSNKLQKPAQYAYFFSGLQNPRWIIPLKEQGLLTDDLFQAQEKDGMIRLPICPTSMYVTRIAKEATSDELLMAVEALGESKNPRVLEDLAEALGVLSEEKLAPLTAQIKSWIGTPFGMMLPDRVAILMQKLAYGNYKDQAFALADELLRVGEPLPGKDKGYGRSARMLIDPWQYEEILGDEFATLVVVDSLRSSILLINKLHDAISIALGKDHSEDDKNDHSEIWSPNLKLAFGSAHDDPKKCLLNSLTAAVEHLVVNKPGDLPQLYAKLEPRKLKCFRRLELYTAALEKEPDPKVVAKLLLNKISFDDYSLRQEYEMLLRTHFVKLSVSEQQEILNWIKQGPNSILFKVLRTKMRDGESPTEEELNKHKELWQLEHLIPLKGQLTGEGQDLLELLENRHGVLAPHTNDRIITSWVGPTSPLETAELEKMSAEELAEYLRSWSAPEDGDDLRSSPDGLARVFWTAVEADPGKYAGQLGHFQNLPVVYYTHLYHGFRNSLVQKKSLDWQPILAHSKTVIQELADHGADSNVEEWSSTCLAIASLIDEGLSSDICPIPFNLRHQVWQIIEILLGNADPTNEREAQSRENQDYFSLSINSVRGQAMHCAIKYGLWCMRNAQNTPELKTENAFVVVPELQSALEKHLDVQVEPSLAVRSVYGKYLPWLYLLNSDWTAKKLSQILPRDQNLAEFRSTAWSTYLLFCPVFNDSATQLLGEYEYGLADLPAVYDLKKPFDVHEKFVDHHMVIYWRSLDDGAMCARLFEHAPAKLRKQAIAFIGQSFQSEQKIAAKITKRLHSLWNDRLDFAQSTDAKDEVEEELSEFGSWYASGIFSRETSLVNLNRTLDQTSGKISPVYRVVEQLIDDAEVFPVEVSAAMLKMVIRAQDDDYELLYDHTRNYNLLEKIINTGSLEAYANVEKIVESLVNRNHFQYVSLLKK